MKKLLLLLSLVLTMQVSVAEECPLCYASENGDLAEVKRLIADGADVNAVNNNGWTALLWVASNGKTDIVKALIKAGADINAVDIYGDTALPIASLFGHTDIVKILIKAGVDVNAASKYGKTALIYAAQKGYTDIAKVLINVGADVNAVNNNGWTALMFATLFGKTDMVKVLIDKGADVNAVRNNGETALSFAKQKGYTDIVKILKAATPCETHESDSLECVRYFAEKGNAEAQFRLGVIYSFGRGIKKDDREAVHWFRKSAEQGIVRAQYNLGVMYDDGKGVKEDDREAARWYRKAAEQGDVRAQYNLGVMYSFGRGIKKDDREAVRWYRKSAEQGDASAQYNLGGSYWEGKGVIEDEREAYIWLSIAKANGDEKAAKSISEFKWNEYLTSSEIKSAKKEAKRRLEKIDNRTAQKNQQSASIGEVPAAKPPQNHNIAEKVFENAWRSIVVINNDEGQGSGIIVRPNIVATNCHVIDGDGGNVIVYKHDNRRASTNTPYEATIRYRDDDYDFCLLDVKSLWGIPVTMRKYNTLNIGENVYALGSPKGLDLSLSTGIISQLRRGETNRYIQTDAAISPGSSGGGLFDSEGNLIGILTKKLVDEEVEGIGFAIPADLALDLP